MTNARFSREDMAQLPTRLLRDGRAANACVSCVEFDGKEWTVKDFASRSFWVRWFLAPFLLRHELSILKKLEGIEGVAGEAFLIDSTAIAIRFLPGRPLGRIAKENREAITPEFLAKMEALLDAVHARGVVHLDTRGTGNWLVSPEGLPLLIDFQAALTTQWMPASWRRIVELIDTSGVYKKWLEWSPETMGQARRAKFEDAQKWRKKWKLHGYFGMKKKRGDNKFGEL